MRSPATCCSFTRAAPSRASETRNTPVSVAADRTAWRRGNARKAHQISSATKGTSMPVDARCVNSTRVFTLGDVGVISPLHNGQ